MHCSLELPANLTSTQQTRNPIVAIHCTSSSNPAPYYVKILPKINPNMTTETINSPYMAETWTAKSLPTPQSNFSFSEPHVMHTNAGIMSSESRKIIGMPYTNISTNSEQSQNIVMVSHIVQQPSQTATSVLANPVVPLKPRIRKKRVVMSSQRPIHLLKSGNTYHSMEKLDEANLKVVTNALKRIGNPIKSKKKSIYDDETKTRIKYRVVYPEDLEISETSEIIIKELETDKQYKRLKHSAQSVKTQMQFVAEQDIAKDHSPTTENMKTIELTYNSAENEEARKESQALYNANSRKKVNQIKKEKQVRINQNHKQERVKIQTRTAMEQEINSTGTEQMKARELDSAEKMQLVPEQQTLDDANSGIKLKENRITKKKTINKSQELERTVKVTRSGRRVRLPNRCPTEMLMKPTKHRLHSYLEVLTCLRCHEKFHGAVKLNRHFAMYPTHKPNNMHTNLFLCFLDIMNATRSSEKSYTFIEQLEELIVKIKNMLPCMINNIDSNDGILCCINEDVGRMLDMEPGKYNISWDEAIRCYENKSNKCKHIMKCSTAGMKEQIKTSRVRMGKFSEEIEVLETEDENCARTHSVDQWPIIKKRIKKYLPVKKVCENSPGPNVDVISISSQNEEVMQNNTVTLQTAKVWVVPKETDNNNKTIFKAPAAIQMPVVDVDRKNISADPVKLNLMSIQTPSNHKEAVSSENVVTCTDTTLPPQSQYMSHFDQYQTSHFDIQSPHIKSNNTSFNKFHVKDSFPMFLQLANAASTSTALKNADIINTSEETANIQMDLNDIFSEPINAKKSTTEFIHSANSHAEVSMNPSNEEYRLTSRTEPSHVIDDSRQNDHLSSSQCTDLSHSNYVMSDETSHRSPIDRLLSGENRHETCNDHPVCDVSKNCSALSSIIAHKNQNDFVNSSTGHMSQNDCLLSSRNNHMARNDKLLSSGNIQFPQNDLLPSANIQTPQNDSMVNMCVNETNLEGSRMSLPLLDQLGSDCLSFTDTELRGSSLDLPLDLFPFSHTE